ncbi:unnamed protein product [Psylliodes chrysocephalus]|uniref:Proteasome maturation protein n=1 Tax=Psylliodes chrysocephalus TaxID=3402493 RepID=A0A9P0GAA8_9CUCU|nr:unnamed protein product [Psylliodes chrysocephala]
MSFSLPSVKVKPFVVESFNVHEETYGGQDLMKHGLPLSKQSTNVPHPMAASKLKHQENLNKMNLTILRNTQGLHAPLRINMELKSAKRIGRLPFLSSSNTMYDILMGKDVDIGPEDVFNTSEFSEVSCQPHAVVEKSLGIL